MKPAKHSVRDALTSIGIMISVSAILALIFKELAAMFIPVVVLFVMLEGVEWYVIRKLRNKVDNAIRCIHDVHGADCFECFPADGRPKDKS